MIDSVSLFHPCLQSRPRLLAGLSHLPLCHPGPLVHRELVVFELGVLEKQHRLRLGTECESVIFCLMVLSIGHHGVDDAVIGPMPSSIKQKRFVYSKK